MPSGFFYPYKEDESIHHVRGVCFIIYYFYRYCSKSYAISEDPDQMLHYQTSDMGMYCLPMSLTLLHSEQPKLYKGLAVLSATGLNIYGLTGIKAVSTENEINSVIFSKIFS